MGNDLAVFIAYAAFLVDGNPLTNLLSIGGKSSLTGPDPPQPAIVGGLDTHAVFEGAIIRRVIYYPKITPSFNLGDTSMTRGDFFSLTGS